MNEQDPLSGLRELPLPPLAPELSAKIRKEAHLRLAAGRSPAKDSTRRFSTARILGAAAVVLLCGSHLGWTLTFMSHLHEPTVTALRGAVSPLFGR
ncbi:MAG TPA: hypothetical protein VH062_23990 [Polyangiaceae bacterium]|jgi:hypothetical protein|nr:hypothetical protein [Polyangiaceae bacterium]